MYLHDLILYLWAFVWNLKHVRSHAICQFGFEPGGFGWHDFAGIGHPHQVFHTGGMKRKGQRHASAVNTFFQFAQAADAADKIDALVAPWVFDAQYGSDEVVLQQAYIQTRDGIVLGDEFRLDPEPVPAAGQIQAKFAESRRFDRCGGRFEVKGATDPVEESLFR